MSSIKLKPDTGGGSFEIKAPSNSNNSATAATAT